MSQNYKETLNLPRTDFPMKANLAGQTRAVCSRVGLSRSPHRVQSREGITRAFAARSPQEVGSVRAEVCRHPARTIQTTRCLWRLGASISNDGSQIRSGNFARFRSVC